jgi:hypothetical protein
VVASGAADALVPAHRRDRAWPMKNLDIGLSNGVHAGLPFLSAVSVPSLGCRAHPSGKGVPIRRLFWRGHGVVDKR